MKYYISQGYKVDESLFADTIISFWTIYKRLWFLETGWNIYGRTSKCIQSLLRQTESRRKNDYTDLINKVNEDIETFVDLIYTKGNFMLLPDRRLNNERYSIAEDRIDLSLYEMFPGGK